jgi:hypothetical protein
VTYFKVLLQHLPEGLRKFQRNLSQGSLSPARELGTSWLKAKSLYSQPRQLIFPPNSNLTTTFVGIVNVNILFLDNIY